MLLQQELHPASTVLSDVPIAQQEVLQIHRSAILALLIMDSLITRARPAHQVKYLQGEIQLVRLVQVDALPVTELRVLAVK
jgi:hypothetical protein